MRISGHAHTGSGRKLSCLVVANYFFLLPVFRYQLLQLDSYGRQVLDEHGQPLTVTVGEIDVRC